jgi:hypothetical protein
MDESIRRAFKKDTVNPNKDLENLQECNDEFINQDLENLQDCSDDFINEELRKLSEIEAKRLLKPSEEEKEGILLYEMMSRRLYTKEARNEAAKLEQDSCHYRKRLAENPSTFKENQWVRLKTSSLTRIPDGSEGVILEVLLPDFQL